MALGLNASIHRNNAKSQTKGWLCQKEDWIGKQRGQYMLHRLSLDANSTFDMVSSNSMTRPVKLR